MLGLSNEDVAAPAKEAPKRSYTWQVIKREYSRYILMKRDSMKRSERPHERRG
jgi:hypothetical protein